MSTKGRYQVRDWKEYNKSVIQRGSITVWFSDDAIEKWLAAKEEARAKCEALNMMTRLGMPEGEWLAV